MGGQNPDPALLGEEDVATEDQDRVERPPLFKVLLHNDDYTTVDFVEMVLRTIFHKPDEEASAITRFVHTRGVGVAGIYSHEIAETKVARVMELARANEFPLLCTLEPDL